MRASVNWLSDLVGQPLDPGEVAERLTLLGAAVDAVAPVAPSLDGVVVGVVEHVAQHPNADRLTVCRVEAGNGPVEVVCGAPNVTPGAKYPYAAAGTTLPGGLTLERRKIRGVVSNGMLCSERELELGTDQSGILELETDAPPGTPLRHALHLDDTALELDITPNRPDLLCQRGVARELAAVLGSRLRLPEFPSARPAKAPRRVERQGSVDGVSVEIEDSEGCPRYAAAVIRGVTVGPSPAWLQARVRAVGGRPINNVVDATNYLLHEINQPLHAFDLHKLRGGRVIIRRARAGELLTTLDGEDRALSPDMTMICDAEGPVAVAGVMGGADSEVSDDTRDILLECAYFDPARIRQTRTALKMDTDASYRFERGMDRQAVPAAVRRAVELIIAVAGGEEREGAVDVAPALPQPVTVFLRPGRVAHVLGVSLPQDEIERLLTSVGFTVAPKEDRLAVQVPGWRPDVTREVDLIEEVAWLRGYDSFPVEMRPFRPSIVPDDPSELVADRLRSLLTALGLHEARTMPLGPSHGADAPALQNPLSAEESHLRMRLLPGLVRSVERNWAARNREVRLFEIGRVFRSAGDAPVPAETIRVAGVLTGARRPGHWSDGGGPADLDRWDLKGMLEEVVRVVAPGAGLTADGDGWVVGPPDGTAWGTAGELAADAPPWAGALFGFEVDLVEAAHTTVQFVPLPTTPAAERDLALVLPDGVAAADVERVVHAAGAEVLERAVLFDEYRSADLAGRSVAWRLVFRAPDRTLRDTEVDRAVTRILKRLKDELGVERRES